MTEHEDSREEEMRRWFLPEERLIAAVIESGLIEKDYEYFSSKNFEYHCSLLKLDADVLRIQISKVLNASSKEHINNVFINSRKGVKNRI